MFHAKLGISCFMLSAGFAIACLRAADRESVAESERSIARASTSDVHVAKSDARRALEAEFFEIFRIREVPELGTREYMEVQRSVDETLGREHMFHKWYHAREVARQMGLFVYTDRHRDYMNYIKVV